MLSIRTYHEQRNLVSAFLERIASCHRHACFGLGTDEFKRQIDSRVTEPKILEDVEIQGVQELADSAVAIRCHIKTIALEQWSVRRAFLGRIKQTFDARGIEIPYPHLTLYAGQGRDSNSPAFHVIWRDAGVLVLKRRVRRSCRHLNRKRLNTRPAVHDAQHSSR
jgi:hypothetical protein